MHVNEQRKWNTDVNEEEKKEESWHHDDIRNDKSKY